MLINCADIARLAWLDSVYFDKEGFLFVREKQEGIFNQWKSEAYIERLCRLKGNLLFVLSTSNSSGAEKDQLTGGATNAQTGQSTFRDRKIVYVLVLEECSIKLLDECTEKHYCFIVDFGKNDPTRQFFFATLSQYERDSWVEAIHLSSFTYLRLIYQTFTKFKPSIEDDEITASDENTAENNALIFTVGCNLTLYNRDYSTLNLLVTVYSRKEDEDSWCLLGNSEVVSSCNPVFAKQFHFPPKQQLSSHQFRFKLYDVIERLTETRIFLGEAFYNPSEVKARSTSSNVSVIELELISPLKDCQVIGKLQLYVRENELSEVCPESSSSLRPNSLTIKDTYVPASEQDSAAKSSHSPSCESAPVENAAVKNVLLSSVLSCSVPNSLHPDNSPITPLTTVVATTIMSSPLMVFTLDANLFVNTIHRSFRFEFCSKKASIAVNELMAESTYCLMFPQTLMNIFMDDEKRLMNCVTYSLGEVKSEWQRPQMRVLESHLRLVNVVTESINELYQIQLQKKYFRPSSCKVELFFQFVPINFHLQRCLVTDVDSERNTSTNDESKYRVLDIYTVGAFASHKMGFENGGMQKAGLNAKTPTNNNNRDITQVSVGKAWKAMKNYFKINSLWQQIEATLKRMVKLIEDGSATDEAVMTAYQLVDLKSKTLVTILDAKEMDEALLSLDDLRNLHTPSFMVSPVKRTDSMPLRSPVDDSIYRSQGVKRHNSVPNENQGQSISADEQLELEPLDLLHLNIKASLISMSGKLKKKVSNIAVDFEPSRKKLCAAIEALQRMASIAYAVESIKLQRDHLEQFYAFRLRRDMIFSQALSSVIIAVLGQLHCVKFQQQLMETKVIFAYYESLLSCYAEEIGMLQDMAYAVEEVNECVTFVFITNKEEGFQSCIPRIEGNGHYLRVIIPMASSSVVRGSLECQVTGVLFNVGINEHATLAETFGQVKIQEEINKQSFLRLENFVSNCITCDDQQLFNDLTALKSELWSNRAKNVRILQLMEQITYRLNGIRFTNCKSGKDRTAMAVTLEEVRKVAHLYDFNELSEIQLFQQMLDTLRSEGTRRENTRKNVGVAKYAFNTLRVMTLPKLYRPPPGTYGNVQT